jgi:hypothetical protein
MKYLPSVIVATLLILGGGVFIAHAQGYIPLAPLPETVDPTTGKTDMGRYLAGMLKLIIGLGGVFAILMAIIGGTQYVAASINPSAKSDALSRIQNSFIGLALILSSYLLLNSINPNLVALNLTLPPISSPDTNAPGVAVVGGTAPGECSVSISPLVGEALQTENGEKVIWTASSGSSALGGDSVGGVGRNLFKLHQEFSKLQAALPAGASATANSAYRPLAYQKHLYEVFTVWNITDPKDVCWNTRETTRVEFEKHGLGTAVSPPNACAPHVKGIGIDIKLVGYPYESINGLLQANNIDLSWQGIPGDEVHFNLKNPPYAGCAQ